MNRSHRIWYALALVLTVLPAGARLLWWQRSQAQPVDPVVARAGETLFNRDWKPKDSSCPEGDGLGPVFNATSCVACHHQGGAGGGGGLQHNVTAFIVRTPGMPTREGVVHAFGTRGRETLQNLHPSLPAISQPTLEQVVRLSGREDHCLPFPTGVHLSQRNTPALFGSKLIDEIPDRVILANARSQRTRWAMGSHLDESIPVGRPSRLADGRIGKFGWKGQTASLSDFVQAACANELGLGDPGSAQPTPLFIGTPAPTLARTIDLTLEQCNQLTAFCASLPRPTERVGKDGNADQAARGKKLFHTVGCAECHTPNLGSVTGLYSDLLLHRMGAELVGGGSYGEPPVPVEGRPDEATHPSEWRTPPLWGVADSAPYLHDGRAATLEEAIRLHGGQGKRSADRFQALNTTQQADLIAFLKTLRVP